jgi:hypothetical protein
MVFTDNTHLVATTLDELHEFAQKIGLKRSWFQAKKDHPHYDLMGSKKDLAIKKGAELIHPFELVKKFHNNELEMLDGYKYPSGTFNKKGGII